MVIFIDMDDTIADYTANVKKYKTLNPTQPFPQAQWGFFLELEPLPGAIESIKYLVEIGHDVRFLSRPSTKNYNCYSEKAYWISKFLGPEWVDKLILSCDKSIVKGDILIDDQGGFGQEEFEGKWIRFGSDEFPDWTSVMVLFS
jgi:5'(3')-deoxyribonucleotidase